MYSTLRKFLFLLPVIFLSFQSFAQGISYQAVARDGSGVLEANENINVRFSILEGTANGTEVYRETHATTTNNFALFAVIIGKGTVENGIFDDIDWGSANHFLKVEVNGSDMGTTQLETVPYSKVATAMNIDHLTDVSIGAVAVDDVLTWDGSAWVNAAPADPSSTNEIQTLSVNGGNLELSNGGGSVPMGSSPWTQSGTDVTYSGGSVGIGTAAPVALMEITGSNPSSRLMTIEKTNVANSNDILEISAQTGAPDGAQFIEFQRGTTVEARINTDGSAEFTNVTVDENLDATTAPVSGRVYANGLPIAYGYVSSGTTTASLITDYGVASITKTAATTGEYRIVLDKTIVGQPVIIATSYHTSANDEIVTANRVSGSEIEINVADGSGTAVNSNFYFIVFGEVQ